MTEDARSTLEKSKRLLADHVRAQEGEELLEKLPQGHGSGLDADMVDGLHAMEIIAKGQVLRGWVFAGTGCMLVKRRVFEYGLRFEYQPSVAGPDIFFMFQALKAGFTAALHGDVECGHLPEFPLTYKPVEGFKKVN